MSTKWRDWKLVLPALPVLVLAAALALLAQLRVQMMPISSAITSDTAPQQSAVFQHLLSELDKHPLARLVTVMDCGNLGKGDTLTFRMQTIRYNRRKHTLWVSTQSGSYDSRTYEGVSIDALRAVSKIHPPNPYDVKPVSDALGQHGCKRVPEMIAL